MRNGYNNFQNIVLLEYKGCVAIKISVAETLVPETLYSIINMLET